MPARSYNHDYVECSTVAPPRDLAGLSIQYASATGTGNFSAKVARSLGPTGSRAVTTSSQISRRRQRRVSSHARRERDGLNGGGAGKVVLVNSTAALACNGGSTPCSSAQLR